ncbi:MAG: VCBS repeat-containing protein [Acidobacteria bacterium]|nr:VCBS repeat-containing protein [Acidobacteriota bacterium]
MKNQSPARTRILSRLVAALSLAACLCLMSGRHARAGHLIESPTTTDSILQAMLTLPDLTSNNKLGYSVALSGNTAIVGSPNRNTGSLSTGRAAIFQRTGLTWSLQAELRSNETVYQNLAFGNSVAIDGDTAVVGAPRILPGGYIGIVYVFHRDGGVWAQQQRIEGDLTSFGQSVAISGDTMVVGNPYNTSAGEAVVYRYNGSTWAVEAHLIGPERTPGDEFGHSVAIDGDTIVVSAWADNTDAGNDTGSATVFSRNGTTWTQQAFLTATDPHVEDFFGTSVAINGSTIAVGAHAADAPGVVNSGAVYVFGRSGASWSETTKLIATDARPGDRLGSSVSLSGNTLVAGANFYDLPDRLNTGAAYIFQRSNNVWGTGVLQYTDDGATNDIYGSAVAISDNTLITGAPQFDKNGMPDSGAAYAYLTRQSLRRTSDFDGDGKTDLSVFRPTDQTWYAQQSATGLTFVRQFGASGDQLVPADYDGDGRADVAVFRPSSGAWYLLNSSSNTLRVQPFGALGDVPAPGDYDGNGLVDLAVFRPSNNTWYITDGINGLVHAEQFGAAGDRAVASDYDGDGRTDLAVVRPSNNTWYIQQSGAGTLRAVTWGAAGDVAVPADYNGDTRTDIAVFRPSNNTWYIRQSVLNQSLSQQWGSDGDAPAPADYDGDGKTDICVFRPSNGYWYILQSGSNSLRAAQWGTSGDAPVPSSYNQ